MLCIKETIQQVQVIKIPITRYNLAYLLFAYTSNSKHQDLYEPKLRLSILIFDGTKRLHKDI